MMSDLSKQRKACLHCYQKKVRCDYSSQESKCTRCAQDGVDCELPDETTKPMRHSIRENVQDLTARVQTLEEALIRSREPWAGHSTDYPPSDEQLISRNNGASQSGAEKQQGAAVRMYRGPHSPWSLLVDRVKRNSTTPDLVDFRAKAARLADADRSTQPSSLALPTDALDELEKIGRDDLFRYLAICDENAPFPILHFKTLLQVATQILDAHSAERSGQIASLLIYVAFAVAQSEQIESDTNQLAQSGKFFTKAFKMLPNLILESDLWALKALTLMVHYLQASSKPQQCWTLLGAASRMAITLGFHRGEAQIDSYSAIELEEGNRAWWLCYIMDKTFSAAFDYPSTIDNHMDEMAIRLPTQFQPTDGEQQELDNTNANAGIIDSRTVEFFREMIELSRHRDSLLKQDGRFIATPNRDFSEIMRTVDRRDRSRALDANPTASLRRDISDLAHNNAILVVSAHLMGLAPPHPDSIRHARRSLSIITSAKTMEHAMCLWMWMYYGFTAGVVLFLHSLAEPSHDEVIMDLALLSELQTLCAFLAIQGSEGCQRLMEVLDLMEKVVMSASKASALKNSMAKRDLETDGSGEGPHRDKIQRTTNREPTESRPSSRGPPLDAGETGDLDTGFWDTLPQTFAWDEWGQWLEEWPLD